MNGAAPARVPLVLQTNPRECGAACLAMVLGAHGVAATLADCRRNLRTEEQGVSASALVGAARALGLRARGFKAPGPEEVRLLPLPAIAHWDGDHYVVLESANADGVSLLDPSLGRRTLDWNEFSQGYSGSALTFERDGSGSKAPLAERPGVIRRLRRFSALPAVRRCLGPLAAGALVVYVLAAGLPLLAGWVLDHRLQHQLEGAASVRFGPVASPLVILLVLSLVVALLAVGLLRNRLLDRLALRLTNLLTSPPALDAIGLPASLAGPMGASARHLVWHSAHALTRHALGLWVHGVWVVVALPLVAASLPVMALASLLAVGAHALLLVGGARARTVELGREASAGSDSAVRAGHLLLSTSTDRDRRGLRGLALGVLRTASVGCLAWLGFRAGIETHVSAGTLLAAVALSVLAIWSAGAMALSARRLACVGPRIDAVDMAITTAEREPER